MDDSAREIIRDLLALAGIGDCGMTPEVMQQLEQTAQRARAYLATPEPAAGPTDEERFDRWWHHEGSAPPAAGDDLEEHTHRISRNAWLLGAYCARRTHQPPQPIPPSEEIPEPGELW